MGSKKDRQVGGVPSIESLWTRPEVFTRFDEVRDISRPANAIVINNVLNRHVSIPARIVEIGSGMGELVHRLLPPGSPFVTAIEQTEQSSEVVAAHKAQYPDSGIRQANVYSLPYANESLDSVIGYASFDTFADMSKAVAEMQRVLKPGGKIIHFLDINPSTHPFFYNHAKGKDKRIPLIIEQEHIPSVALVQRADFSNAVANLRKNSANQDYTRWLEKYGKNPEAELRNPSRPDLLSRFQKFCDQIVEDDSVQTETFSFQDYFAGRLHNSLTKQGFTIHQFGHEQADVLTEMPNKAVEGFEFTDEYMRELQDALAAQLGMQVTLFDSSSQTPRKNTFFNNQGRLYEDYDSSISSGMQKISSNLHVVVAEKPLN